MNRFISFIVALFFMLILLPTPPLHASDEITVTTNAQLLAALSNPANTNIVSQGATANLNFTVNEGVTLTLNINSSPIVHNGVLTNHGNIIINLGKYINYYDEKEVYYNITSYNQIENYGNITFTGKFYNSDLAGWGTGLINNHENAVFTIASGSRFSNDSGATINNYGTFKFYGEFTGSGTFNNYGTTEQPVELLKDGNKVGSYTTLEDALTAANLAGSNYEIHISTDITFDCAPIPPYNYPPIYPMVPNIIISGKKNDGSLSTLTFTGNNYNPSQYVILKDINIACSPGFRVFSNSIGLQGEVHLPAATYSTVNVSGSGASTGTLSCSALNLSSGASFTADNITASNITLNTSASLSASGVTSTNSLSLAGGSKLSANTVSVKNLTLGGGTITVNNNGLLTITGAVSGSAGTFTLPLPSVHGEAISSVTFDTGSSVNASTKITVQPAEGVTIPNDSRLILLKNSAISQDRFLYGDAAQIFKKATFTPLTYLTLRDAPYPTTLAQEPTEPITYGEGTTLTVSASRTSTSEPIPGTVKFYKGNTELAGNLIATVTLSGGKATCSLTPAQLNQAGENQFLAVYTDPNTIYAKSSILCTVSVNAKALSITGANVSSKPYDGKTDAQLNSITLSGIVGSEDVHALAVAAFTDETVGDNKAVNLTSVNLQGTAASHYSVSPVANNVPTAASISKAAPALSLQAAPDEDLAPGENIMLTAGITGVPEGISPTGSVTFKDGSSVLETVSLAGDIAQFDWYPTADGSHAITAEYSGDDSYAATTKTITLDLSKRTQSALSVGGVPDTITYGDAPFVLSVTGGSGTGSVGFEVTSGTSVSVNEHGTITINSARTATITVTKSGDVTYNPASTEIIITVERAIPTLTVPPEADKVYRGRTLAESAIHSGEVTGVLGETLEGTFLWVDTTVPVTANGDFDALFVPQSGNYSSLPITIPVELKKAIPIIKTPPTVRRVNANSLLKDCSLTGGAAIGLDNIDLTGTFAWENPDEIIKKTARYKVVFTPDNLEDYEIVTFDLKVMLNQASPSNSEDADDGYITDEDINTNESSVIVNISSRSRISPLQMVQLAEFNKDNPVIFSGTDYRITFAKGALKPGIIGYDFSLSLQFGDSGHSAVNRIAGDDLILSLEFGHSGNLPGKADIQFYVGTQYSGKSLYYYYYNPSDNRVTLMQPVVVNENGYAEVSQSHCSTFFVTAKRLDSIIEIPETGSFEPFNSLQYMICKWVQMVFGLVI